MPHELDNRTLEKRVDLPARRGGDRERDIDAFRGDEYPLAEVDGAPPTRSPPIAEVHPRSASRGREFHLRVTDAVDCADRGGLGPT